MLNTKHNTLAKIQEALAAKEVPTGALKHAADEYLNCQLDQFVLNCENEGQD